MSRETTAELLKGAQVFFVAAAGAAAAIPGMAALQELRLPEEAQNLFPFILGSFSAAAVLMAYVMRGEYEEWSVAKTIVSSAAGLVAVLGLFLLFIFLLNRVWVQHTWRSEPAREFVPLFLGEPAERLIRAAGSRSQLISTKGVDVLTPFATETNLALTLAVLLICYTALVFSLAGVFSMLFFRASARGRISEDSVPTENQQAT
jgi:hypothetical protein